MISEKHEHKYTPIISMVSRNHAHGFTKRRAYDMTLSVPASKHSFNIFI